MEVAKEVAGAIAVHLVKVATLVVLMDVLEAALEDVNHVLEDVTDLVQVNVQVVLDAMAVQVVVTNVEQLVKAV